MNVPALRNELLGIENKIRKEKNIVKLNGLISRKKSIIATLQKEREVVAAKDFFTDMNNEDRLRFLLNTVAISALSDLMYGYIIDSVSLINKVDPHSTIDQFDGFLKAGKEAKSAYQFFLEAGTDKQREDIAKISDEMYLSIDSMLKQKVSKLIIDKTKKK